MDIIKVKECIEKLISEIGKCRREIEAKGQARAKAITEYDKAMAITMSMLRNDKLYMLAGKEYPQPPVTIIEKLAKGICEQQRYDMEIAESGYRACISNLEALKAQLNGYQSIYKHLDSV
jgi:hypothetical protein